MTGAKETPSLTSLAAPKRVADLLERGSVPTRPWSLTLICCGEAARRGDANLLGHDGVSALWRPLRLDVSLDRVRAYLDTAVPFLPKSTLWPRTQRGPRTGLRVGWTRVVSGTRSVGRRKGHARGVIAAPTYSKREKVGFWCCPGAILVGRWYVLLFDEWFTTVHGQKAAPTRNKGPWLRVNDERDTVQRADQRAPGRRGAPAR